MGAMGGGGGHTGGGRALGWDLVWVPGCAFLFGRAVSLPVTGKPVKVHVRVQALSRVVTGARKEGI